jgi:hypothetical protein
MFDVNLVVSENVTLADDTITLPVCTLSQVALILMLSKSHYETSCIPYILESNPHSVFGDFLNGN